jgi:Na+-translocating ferredoxin:NAD+ oxidoreductase RnfA subunit
MDIPIPEFAKIPITLLGWPYIIDGVRVLFGRQSFMRKFSRYALYTLAVLTLIALVFWLAMWVYESLSLKALAVIGFTVVIALLVSILRELRESRSIFSKVLPPSMVE